MTAAAKLEVRERPILFSAPMIRAILSGAKTQTRRAMKPQPVLGGHLRSGWHWSKGTWNFPIDDRVSTKRELTAACPYGQPGDLLWVRETWGYRGAAWSNRRPDHHQLSIAYQADGTKRSICRSADDWSGVPKQQLPPEPAHDADWAAIENRAAALDRYWKSWRPSIHMLRWASRIQLKVTGVRVERLQDISEEDAREEGVEPCNRRHDYGECAPGFEHRCAFQSLWSDINGEWNPGLWVWVVVFERVTP